MREQLESVYLETTFISYLVSRPSRDLIIAAHQQITSEWWNERKTHFNCVVSQAVIQEALRGDTEEIEKRRNVLDGLDVLPVTAESEDFAGALIAQRIIPEKAFGDAAHIAIASAHQCDYFLTWNCKHLANAQIIKRIQRVCDEMNMKMPFICTPEELMEVQDD